MRAVPYYSVSDIDVRCFQGLFTVAKYTTSYIAIATINNDINVIYIHIS